MSLIEVEPGVFSAIVDGVVREARVDGNVATIQGRRYSLVRADPRKYVQRGSGSTGEGRGTVRAPMPGKVVRLLVKVGDDVEAGQGVAVVEAMKMQNELKAARAGRVAAIHAKEGGTVNAGDAIAVVESLEAE